MKGGNESSEERLEELDEEGLECREEFIDVSELKNPLIRDLGERTILSCR